MLPLYATSVLVLHLCRFCNFLRFAKYWIYLFILLLKGKVIAAFSVVLSYLETTTI